MNALPLKPSVPHGVDVMIAAMLIRLVCYRGCWVIRVMWCGVDVMIVAILMVRMLSGLLGLIALCGANVMIAAILTR